MKSPMTIRPEKNSFLNYESSKDYPALANLVGSYFHQDYDIVSEDHDEVVRVFAKDNNPWFVKSVISNISVFLERHQEDDPELARVFETLFRPDEPFHQAKYRTTREALLKTIEILTSYVS